MASVDVEELRQRLLDYCGTAAAMGMPAALLDVARIEDAGPEELIHIAQQLGVL